MNENYNSRASWEYRESQELLSNERRIYYKSCTAISSTEHLLSHPTQLQTFTPTSATLGHFTSPHDPSHYIHLWFLYLTCHHY